MEVGLQRQAERQEPAGQADPASLNEVDWSYVLDAEIVREQGAASNKVDSR